MKNLKQEVINLIKTYESWNSENTDEFYDKLDEHIQKLRKTVKL